MTPRFGVRCRFASELILHTYVFDRAAFQETGRRRPKA